MNKQVFVCAHRGASGTHPENTIPAFAETVSLGCEMVEFDVRATADGAMVLLHDASVDRTTNGSGQIWQLSLAEVLQLDASPNHPDYANTPIPTLEEVLDFLPRQLQLNIHVYPGPADGAAIVSAVCDQISTRDLYDTAFVAGTDEVMELVISRDAKVRRCLLGSQNRAEIYARRAKEMGCSNVQPLNSITTEAFCAEAHQLGLIVHPFYADDQAEMGRLIQCGVDGILTNHPKRLIQLLESESAN